MSSFRRFFAAAGFASLVLLSGTGPAAADAPFCGELPVIQVPHPGSAGEAYFSPDGNYLIAQGKLPGENASHTYIYGLNSGQPLRVNGQGVDGCSFFYPDGEHVLWTSTRDHTELAAGNYSDATDYPQGAELYISDLLGERVVRLTDNRYYDSEVSASPDGRWILFTRQVDGNLDLWRMRPDGSGERQITFTPDLQEGGAFYLSDSETIIYRAWRKQDEASPGRAMGLFLIDHDGTNLRPVLDDGQLNWSPYPAPDGRHIVFVKLLAPRNYEIFLLDLFSGEQRRLTYNSAFDAFPSISPDGRWLAFTSSRGSKEGTRTFGLFLMDISSLGIGPQQ